MPSTRSSQEAGYGRHPTDLYPDVFQALEAIKAGDTSGTAVLIAFLERDVFTLGSGYLKSDAAKAVARLPMTDPRQRLRLQQVVLRAIDGPPRREYGSYIRLARAVDEPAFRDAIKARAFGPDKDVADHARWFLKGMSARR